MKAPAPPAIENGVFILLPVLNEIANIGPLLDRIGAALKGIRFTVGILDDGSTDGTIEYVRERMEHPGQDLHTDLPQEDDARIPAWRGPEDLDVMGNLSTRRTTSSLKWMATSRIVPKNCATASNY